MASNPFLSPENLNPRIVKDVTAAYLHNTEHGNTADTTFAGKVSTDSLARNVRNATISAESSGSIHRSSFDQLSDPDTRQAFEAGFTTAKQLFGRINLAVPTIDTCIDSGIDLTVLGTAYEHMVDSQLEPEIVLSPRMNLESWNELYKALSDDPSFINRGALEGNGLVLGNLVASYWSNLDILPASVPSIVQLSNENINVAEHTWSLRLISGTPRGHSHNVGPNKSIQHPIVSEYLTLQASRMQAQKEPVDNDNGFCWLRGRLAVGLELMAPIGFLNANNEVCICWTEASMGSRSLSTRVPVWE